MNGYLKNFKEQIDTLNDVYYELIKPIEDKSTLKDWWVFGGGTALSIFHFNHRKSFDIDIFVTIDSRFISYDDLEKLSNALDDLNMTQYKLEIDKIEHQTDEYMKIAIKGKDIIQKSIKKILS